MRRLRSTEFGSMINTSKEEDDSMCMDDVQDQRGLAVTVNREIERTVSWGHRSSAAREAGRRPRGGRDRERTCSR